MTEVTSTPEQTAAQIARIIRTDSERWHQNTWFDRGDIPITIEQPYALVDLLRESLETPGSCGSTACVAGWAAILTAPKGSAIIPSTLYRTARLLHPNGTEYAVDAVGRHALGLTIEQAQWLFAGGRSEDEVLTVLDAIADGAPDRIGSLISEPDANDDD